GPLGSLNSAIMVLSILVSRLCAKRLLMKPRAIKERIDNILIETAFVIILFVCDAFLINLVTESRMKNDIWIVYIFAIRLHVGNSFESNRQYKNAKKV
ncbi:hypothetical protein, partial [Pedobacter sp.]|uniref:hypothetical protein n=1 Tax=Pedobacter sp. TaxID=1411316 RepID=UPI002D069D08